MTSDPALDESVSINPHVLVKSLGDYSACFCKDSGTTHIIGPFPALVLDILLEHGVLTTDGIQHQIDNVMGEERPPSETIAALKKLVQQKLITLH